MIRMFVGSSTEALPIARAIKAQIETAARSAGKDVDVVVWQDDPDYLTKSTLEWLVSALGRYDFAGFVFAGDDQTTMRTRQSNSVRDNVLFEAGLFIGHLGRERTFIVYDSDARTAVKIPSDLSSIGFAAYSGDRAKAEDGSNRYEYNRARGALSDASSQIVDQIVRQGSRPDVAALQSQVSDQRKQIQRQEDVIRQLVIYSMSDFIFNNLVGVYRSQQRRDTFYWRPATMLRDFRYLIDNNFIAWADLDAFRDGEDIAPRVQLTPVGLMMIVARQELTKDAGAD